MQPIDWTWFFVALISVGCVAWMVHEREKTRPVLIEAQLAAKVYKCEAMAWWSWAKDHGMEDREAADYLGMAMIDALSDNGYKCVVMTEEEYQQMERG